MSTLTLYLLLTVIPNIKITLMVLNIILSVGCILLIIGWSCADADEINLKKFKKFVISSVAAFILVTVGNIITPQKADIAILLGYKYYTQSNEAQKLPENILKKLNSLLEDK